MGDFADQFGSWSTLGIIAPNTTSWNLFSGNAANSKIFRLTFDTNWPWWEREEKFRFRSYALLKEEYQPVGTGTADPSVTQTRQKIVPQKSQLLIQIDPLPFNFTADGIKRQLKIKRFYWSSQNWELTQPALDISWNVKIEAMENY